MASPLPRITAVSLFAASLAIAAAAGCASRPAATAPERKSTHEILDALTERPPGSCPRFFFRSRSPGGRSVPECPDEHGFHALPRTYPPGAIFVGYAQHEIQVDFLQKLIARARRFDPPLPVNILVPREDVETAYYTLEPYLQEPYSDFVNVVLTPSDETLWTQDYFETGVRMENGRATIVDLPYHEREGEQIPSGVALSCHMSMVPQAPFTDGKEVPGNGDYGGNVEPFPGKLLLVGNNMTRATREVLDSYFDNELLTVDVAWLEIGHVDEIISVVPLRNASGPCDFAVTYASPALGLEVLSRNEFSAEESSLFPQAPADVETEVTIQKSIFARCFSEISRSRNPRLSASDAAICEGFVRANREYERIIQENLRKVSQRMTQKLGCSGFGKIPLPQLFAPDKVHAVFGTKEDLAIAVNPNAINSISLEDALFVPEQPYKPFHDEIVRRLRPTGLTLEYIDGSYVHYLSGGIHCISNSIPVCRPKDPSRLRQSGRKG